MSAAVSVARRLIEAGIPVFAARPALDVTGDWLPAGGTGGCGYWLPASWERTVATPAWLDPEAPGFADKAWRPGWALCALMGCGLDLLDVDPRNGGDAERAALVAGDIWPRPYGAASTPSGGTHEFVASLHVGSRDNLRLGLDIKGGLPDGSGRGFAFIAPTVKLSKTTGELVEYVWTSEPDLEALAEGDDTGEPLAELVKQARGGKVRGSAQALLDPSTGRPHTGPILDGERHWALVSYAGSLRRRDVHLHEARALMRLRWQECAQPPDARTPLPWEEGRGQAARRLRPLPTAHGRGRPRRCRRQGVRSYGSPAGRHPRLEHHRPPRALAVGGSPVTGLARPAGRARRHREVDGRLPARR